MRRARASRVLGRILLAAWLAACGDAEPPPAPVSPEPAPEQVADPPEPAPEPAAAPRRALWVLCQGSARVLDDPTRLDALFETAAAFGATDLFVQVYRRGQAWYESDVVDNAPFRAIVARTGIDTLRLLLERAQVAGVRVHAWVNVLSLADNRDPATLARFGEGAVMVDHRGRSVLTYPKLELPEPDRRTLRMGTPAVWLDPAAPGVAEAYEGIFGELMRRYPEFDGLHLDYIRYPDVLPFSPGARFGVGVQFGYGAPTRARFRAETGKQAPFGESLANANAWDDWRRGKLTELVTRIRTAADAARPGVQISAAVWAYADRAYLALFQDWRGWLADGQVAFAVPMLYSRDDHLFGLKVQELGGSPWADRLFVGFGAWLFAREPARAAAQMAQIEAAGLAPAVFSYDSIAEPDAAALRAALLPPRISDGP